MGHTNFRALNRRRATSLILALLCGVASTHASAEPGIVLAESADQNLTLDEVVVTATRRESGVMDIPATVTAINRSTIDRNLPYDEAALFKDEPDIAMSRDLRRFGSTRVNIRGIEDNRVTQMVDGIRMADYFDGSGPSNFTISRPLGVSMEFLRQVEILRGPASSLYGSDAIGGVVGYLTLNPSDLIEDGKNYGARYRIGYSGINSAWTNTLLGALQGEAAEFLLGYTQSEGHSTDNKGTFGGTSKFRSSPNPQDSADEGVLAKLILHPSAENIVTLTLEGRNQDSDTELKRLTAAPTLQKVTQMAGKDKARRERASIEWQYMPEGTFFDRLTTRLYHQDNLSKNFNQQTRSNTSAACSGMSGVGNLCHIEQDFHFQQKSTGGGLQFESITGWWSKDHLLTYGADLSITKTEELRDATRWNLTTGTSSKTLAGDNFPLRDFANGRTETVGIFIQDEITGWSNGKLTLIPGLRYDWQRIKPDVDALAQQFLTANNRQAEQQTNSAISPKIAARWQLDSQWSLYGQAVRGFRAPNYEEVNSSFRNTVQSYGISPNPNLEPETSIGLEIGAKLHTKDLRGQISIYDNHYKNFIENIELSCPTDPSCIAGLTRTNMFVNLSRVRIYGAELRGAWDFAPGWKLDGAVAWTHGENESDNEPLNSVEPARASIGLLRDAVTWGVETRLRGALAVTRTDDRKAAWYRPAGYAITDIGAWWRPTKSSILNMTINNLFDKKYWLWSDIRQADSEAPFGVDFYSQPGRSLSASFTYNF